MKKLIRLPLFALFMFFAVTWSKAQSPVISFQPQSQITGAGSNVTFFVGIGGGNPILPSVASGTLRLWLKADAGVTLDGSKVTEWKDQSPNVNHASQADENLQPLLVNNAFSLTGKPAIRFDGIQSSTMGDFLQAPGLVNIAGNYTSFLVYNKANRTVTEEAPVVVGVPNSGSAIRSHYIRTFSISNEMAFSGWGNDVGTGFSIPVNTARIWTDRLSGTQLGFFDTDGVNSFSTTQSIGGLITPAAGYFIGGLGSFTRNFQGDIAEVIFYQGALNESDRVLVEGYLKERYFQNSTPGGGTLTYQWKFGGTNLAGMTSSSLTLTNVQPQQAGSYSVIVSNNFGETPSSNAVLTVVVPPSITIPPAKQGGLLGFTANFSVTAVGTPPLQYQWFFNGSTIAGATSSTFSLTGAQLTNQGGYSVRVTNFAGSAQSENAALIILTIPSILTQPVGQTVLAGTNITLLTVAESSLPEVPLGNLRLWLKADSGIITTNGFVAEWRDQSLNGNHAFQPNTNKQPVFVGSAGIGNKPTVRFDGIQNVGTGDWMHGSNSVDIPTGYTSFLVYSRANRTIPEQAAVGIGIPAQQGALRSHFIRTTGEMAFSGWNEDRGTGFIIPADTYRIWTERLDTTKTSLEFFDTVGTNSLSFSSSIVGLATPGPGYYIGGLDSFTRNFQGDISELLVYQGALSDADRLVVQSYLAGKYFLGLNHNIFTYQWQINGTNIAGATNASLALTNSQPSQSGIYTVILTNLAGSVTSAPALVKIRYLFPRENGQRMTNSHYDFVNSVNISFESFFTNGTTFYTLDGSTPSFTSEPYTGPFLLNTSALLRAITYSIDFFQSGESDPVNITITPTYSLLATTSGGGSVALNGSNPFLSNSIVNVTATPSNGWTFLQWLGDASGTNPITPVTMTRNKSVQAVFGTTLSTTAAGSGAIFRNPVSALYPFGAIVHLIAAPEPGNYFGVWGNAASGNTNPLDFAVITANPTVSSLFSALSAGQFSLTLSANGSGHVSASPRANRYSSGQTISLTATPDAGQNFTGWSGDASGTANPLNVTMNQSKAITANFTETPRLEINFSPSTVAIEGFRLSLTGPMGESYLLQDSTNLINWSTIAAFTNSYGTSQFSDLPSTNSSERFYRAVQP
jgi:hypothetical protein